jgi:sulfoxide reductase heme-binding subunit YedZ
MKLLKTFVFIVCLAPFLWLIWAILADASLLGSPEWLPAQLVPTLGADPVDALRDFTGDWIMRLLVITLAITPLRQITGWNRLIRFRRMFGLYAFFYASLHFVTYLWLDKIFDFSEILKDIEKRPYITVGFAAFLLLLPLAVTSTRKWIARLGGKRWQLLHRSIYIIAAAAVIHYFGMVKLDTRYPWRYTYAFALLLGFRLYAAIRQRRMIPLLGKGGVGVVRPTSE